MKTTREIVTEFSGGRFTQQQCVQLEYLIETVRLQSSLIALDSARWMLKDHCTGAWERLTPALENTRKMLARHTGEE